MFVWGADGSGVCKGTAGQLVPKAKQTMRGKGDAEARFQASAFQKPSFGKVPF